MEVKLDKHDLPSYTWAHGQQQPRIVSNNLLIFKEDKTEDD